MYYITIQFNVIINFLNNYIKLDGNIIHASHKKKKKHGQ